MATEPDGWLERLKAKVEDALASGNRRLDEMEAERARERADKPWLSEGGEAPTLDQVRARIEWEEGRTARRGGEPTGTASGDTGPDLDPERTSAARRGSGETVVGRPDPFDTSAAEREALRIEMAERERASRERLDKIRRELGVDPEDGGGNTPGST